LRLAAGALAARCSPDKRGAPSLLLVAADDLRNALVAHREDGGDFAHRQPVVVGAADRFVALRPQPLGLPLKLLLAIAQIFGKRPEIGLSFG